MRTNLRRLALVGVLGVAGMAVVVAARAEESRINWRRLDPSAAQAGWTAEDLASARPMPIPVADLSGDPEAEPARRANTSPGARSSGSAPQRPVAGLRVEPERLYDPGRVRRPRRSELRQRLSRPAGAMLSIKPSARGAQGLDFTSSRLIPSDARLTWPHSAVGKLFLSDGPRRFVCSAAVISARVVVTAGHCVYGNDRFFEDFLFVPAFHLGEAPLGSWTANFVATSEEWMATENVPNRGDWGVLVMEDQEIDGRSRKIGQVTGWFGYVLNALFPNHVHIFGYPANIDSGQRMIQVVSGQHGEFRQDTAFYGSDMEGGASGGPMVQNFGRKGTGGLSGSKNKKLNRIVGVSSFASGDGSDEILGASILTSSFKELFEQACADAAGNCTKRGKPNSN